MSLGEQKTQEKETEKDKNMETQREQMEERKIIIISWPKGAIENAIQTISSHHLQLEQKWKVLLH